MLANKIPIPLSTLTIDNEENQNRHRSENNGARLNQCWLNLHVETRLKLGQASQETDLQSKEPSRHSKTTRQMLCQAGKNRINNCENGADNHVGAGEMILSLRHIGEIEEKGILRECIIQWIILQECPNYTDSKETSIDKDK